MRDHRMTPMTVSNRTLALSGLVIMSLNQSPGSPDVKLLGERALVMYSTPSRIFECFARYMRSRRVTKTLLQGVQEYMTIPN